MLVSEGIVYFWLTAFKIYFCLLLLHKVFKDFHTCKLNYKKEWDLPELLPWETRQEQQRFVLWWWALTQIPHRKTRWFSQIAQWPAPLYPILKQSQKIRVIFHCTIYTCSIKCFKIWCLRLLPQLWHINHKKKTMYIPKLFKSLMLSKFTAAPISPNNKGWNNIHIMPTTSAMVSWNSQWTMSECTTEVHVNTENKCFPFIKIPYRA